MNGENSPYIFYYILLVVLIASSLIGMRLPLKQAAKMILAWVAIFGLVFIIVAFRSEFANIGQRLRAEATGSEIVAGETVRIPMSDDGHFWVTARLNGQDVRFMVDSGASVTTVSRTIAQAAGIPITFRRVMVSTANGRAWVTKSHAEALQIGPIERFDFAIDVNETDDMNLLGMNFLSSLESWRVEGRFLVLQA
jgi:aspartyl protease family protein